jgi:prepilin-type N-terminal cleavage/methylation domain-containing protein
MRRRRLGFTLIEILIAIVILTLGILAVVALLTQSVKAAGEVVEDSFAATLARSVYESVREGAQRRAFLVEESGNNVRGFVFVHDGVMDKGSPTPFTPPPLPANSSDTGRLNALRRSDFAIFLPDGSPYPPPAEVYFVFPRPTQPNENDWVAPAGGQDDSFFALNPIPARKGPKPDYAGNPNRFDIQRVYSLRNRPTAPPSGALEDAGDQYSFALAIRRASAPVLTGGGGNPIQWGPNTYPPKNFTPQDGLYQVEVMVFRNFEAETTSRHHQPVNGGHFVGLIAVGP